MRVRRFVLGFALAGFPSACSSSPGGPATGSGGTGSGGSNATAVSMPSGASSRGTSAYAPNPVTIASGTTVTWTNNDTIAHTSTSDTAGVFNSGVIAAGGSFSFTFQTRGTVTYHCTIHPGMMGTVVVQ